MMYGFPEENITRLDTAPQVNPVEQEQKLAGEGLRVNFILR
jgi:hypothetical protein